MVGLKRCRVQGSRDREGQIKLSRGKCKMRVSDRIKEWSSRDRCDGAERFLESESPFLVNNLGEGG